MIEGKDNLPPDIYYATLTEIGRVVRSGATWSLPIMLTSIR